jgi:predicted MPP superfamily phosphohydrolase
MKIFPIIMFFTLVLAILLGAHFFVFTSLSRFLNLSSILKKLLALSFILLTFGFVGSSVYGHYVSNASSQFLYILTSSWLGLFSNLFWAVIIFWPIYLLLETRISPANLTYIMAVLIMAALASTTFGYFNAQNIRYRQEVVKIKDLPTAWRGKKIVQLSDVHLNNVHNEEFLKPIIESINKQKPAAVFLTGDFYDGMDGRLEEMSEPLQKIESERGVYFISGNHEMYMGLERATSALEHKGVKILDDKKVDLDGLQIAGLRFPERDGLRRDLVKEIEKLDLKAPSIFLYHDPRQVNEVAATGRVSLMLSGHTHNGQLWPYNYIVRWIYGIYGIGRHQIGEMTQFTTTGVGTWGPAMRTTGAPEVTIFTLE